MNIEFILSNYIHVNTEKDKKSRRKCVSLYVTDSGLQTDSRQTDKITLFLLIHGFTTRYTEYSKDGGEWTLIWMKPRDSEFEIEAKLQFFNQGALYS